MSFKIDPDQLDLLQQARDRARKLVDDVRRKRDELLAARPPGIDADKLAQGRNAMDNAVASAERTLAAVEDALKLVEPPHPE